MYHTLISFDPDLREIVKKWNWPTWNLQRYVWSLLFWYQNWLGIWAAKRYRFDIGYWMEKGSFILMKLDFYPPRWFISLWNILNYKWRVDIYFQKVWPVKLRVKTVKHWTCANMALLGFKVQKFKIVKIVKIAQELV